jgi:hypothetical protein
MDSSDIHALKARCSKSRAYTERPNPPPVEVEAAFLNMCTSGKGYNSWSRYLRRPEGRNESAGEDRQQFNGPSRLSVGGRSRRLGVLRNTSVCRLL